MSTASLAATAAVVSSPSIADASADTDAELFALGAEFDRALAAFMPLDCEARRRYELWKERTTSPPALIATEDDRVLFDGVRNFRGELLVEGLDVGEPYRPVDIEGFKRGGYYQRKSWFSLELDVSKKAAARAVEIEQAWESWRIHQAQVADELALESADEAADQAEAAVQVIVEQMVQLPARSIEALRIKARALAFLHVEYMLPGGAPGAHSCLDERLTWSFMRDFLAGCPRESVPYHWIPEARYESPVAV